MEKRHKKSVKKQMDMLKNIELKERKKKKNLNKLENDYILYENNV